MTKYVVNFDDKVVSTRTEFLPAKLLYSTKTETTVTTLNTRDTAVGSGLSTSLRTVSSTTTTSKSTTSTTETLGTLLSELERPKIS